MLDCPPPPSQPAQPRPLDARSTPACACHCLSVPTPSLRALYREHRGWLQDWLRRRLDCSEQAADLTQDTFSACCASVPSQPGWREPRAYLGATASRAT